MGKHDTKTALLKSLDFWTKERARTIKDGDEIGRIIAERNRENTFKELERLRTR